MLSISSRVVVSSVVKDRVNDVGRLLISYDINGVMVRINKVYVVG